MFYFGNQKVQMNVEKQYETNPIYVEFVFRHFCDSHILTQQKKTWPQAPPTSVGPKFKAPSGTKKVRQL